MEKKTVPNIQPINYLSRDFKLAFGNLSNYLERIRDNESARTRHLAKRAFLHRQIPKYEEFFDPKKFSNVVNEKNKNNIIKLNLFIDELNDWRLQESIDIERLNAIELAIKELLK
jgi:hypothetical protein